MQTNAKIDLSKAHDINIPLSLPQIESLVSHDGWIYNLLVKVPHDQLDVPLEEAIRNNLIGDDDFDEWVVEKLFGTHGDASSVFVDRMVHLNSNDNEFGYITLDVDVTAYYNDALSRLQQVMVDG